MSERINVVILSFAPGLAALRDGLSVAQRIGDTLWVANDEATSLERLKVQGAAPGGVVICDEHQSFSLMEYLDLPIPAPDAEIDIEGLAYDHDRGYLWVVGSHSLKRKKAEPDKPAQKNIKRLSTVEADGNRFLLARIPVVRQGDSYGFAREVDADGRTAARLRGNALGNDLTWEIAKDDQLRDFLPIPGKDNGFDIEGMAVIGPRLLLGLRGPVLRGWAVLLEIEPELNDDSSETLVLKKIGPEGRRYRKHFFALNGLGVRDLCVSGDDLLILAGPTMDLDGPVTVFRWRGGFASDEELVVFAEQLERVLEVPFGQGDDHAEGMCLFDVGEEAGEGLLIVYDAVAPRRKHGDLSVEGDLFILK
ncbi:hypothetical protein C4K38_2675 [Pseudomonas chlororaphis subsp. piscium]|uniref:DUF3616 domain-containing protein n=1 Tax=Pseudomonas chlororaphis TaxID=587753 RepID=UPI0006A62D9B|nr:DUF3616 domain-containing protein [Pseudomonas chlororaphis]AZC30635.1 hypothetical protein C4K38_2675 [Pseudomonas chlororaphis subsp. piscium]WDG94531.1 DUF3616 domain-containing protein [Pseudomonas chlororaphis]SDT13164.1 Protein of unknown function [Pseudomonas chlororaphis]